MPNRLASSKSPVNEAILPEGTLRFAGINFSDGGKNHYCR